MFTMYDVLYNDCRVNKENKNMVNNLKTFRHLM